MNESSGEVYVTWKQLILTLTAIAGLLFGGFSWMVNSHTHPEYGTTREFSSLDKRIEMLEKKIDRLIELRINQQSKD